MNAPVALAVVEVALGIFHYTLGQWFYRLDRSTFLAVVFEKAPRATATAPRPAGKSSQGVM